MNDFYTLTNYLHHQNFITYAMEDYIEMLYRHHLKKETLTITKLSALLHIKKSSCSKMINKLKNLSIIEKNNLILTNQGKKIGKYLYKRHEILTIFLQKLNQKNFTLDQVEKIEHFIDPITLKNIQKLITNNLN